MESSFGSNARSYPSQYIINTNSQGQEPNLNSIMFNDTYLQPLLSLPPLPSESDPSFINFFTQDFPSLPLQPQILDNIVDYSAFPPKTPDHLPDFFSKPLPDLHSLEQPRLHVSSSWTRKLKHPQLDLTLSESENHTQTLDSIVQSFKSPPPSPFIPQSEIARRRRKKISEKTRFLQKLMPWKKKMDTGTMLQEAYKYIKFLQAQISILQSMPITSGFLSSDHQRVNGAPPGFDYGGLGKLNRQQLLQVLVNSPQAQTMLYSQGFCIVSHEQLLLLNKAKERKTGTSTFSLW